MVTAAFLHNPVPEKKTELITSAPNARKGITNMLTKLTKDDFEGIFELIEKSFPTDEYRQKSCQRALFSQPEYEVWGIKNAENALQTDAFISLWRFDGFTYCEHFAVRRELRGCGTGSQILTEILQNEQKRICLEVELPETETAKRRIAFYERNGFTLNRFPYMQPPLGEDREPLPLMIMTSGGAIEKDEFERIRKTLYRNVYRSFSE